MPRIKPLSETQEVKQRLIQNIALIQGARSCETMGKAMGISANTFCRKRKDPESFTLSEVRMLCKVGGVPVDMFITQTLKVGT